MAERAALTMGWLRDTFAGRSGGASAADAASHLQQGTAFLEQRQFEQALEQLERALPLVKRHGGADLHQLHYLLGRAYAGLERPAPASMHFEAAVKAKPDFAEALAEGARVLLAMDSEDEAVEWLQRLVALRPGTASRLELARALRQGERYDEAADLLQQTCAADPRNAEAAVLFHQVLAALGRLEEALVQADRAIKLSRPDAALHVQRGTVLARMARYKDASAAIDQALAIDAALPRALANRVSLLMVQQRVPEAIAAGEAALRRHPDSVDLHTRLGAALMLAGDWERGWAEAEWRLRDPAYHRSLPAVDKPRWQGEDLAGRTIFLYPEQGFGDAIQFVRFVPEIARRAKAVVLLVWPELEALLGATLPANCRTVARGAPIPAHDVQCGLMSLPFLLHTTPATLPAQVPYLQPAPAAVQAWRERLPADRLNVGICWAGNPRLFNDRERSIALAAFRVIATDGCRFHTLQTQKRAGDEQVLANWRDAVDTGAELADFAQTAALVAALDVVVTVDTAVAHLAGALGKSVWILLPYGSEWRWMLEREDSPWYPTARLYRQRAPGNWSQVLSRVKTDLGQLARTRAAAGPTKP